MKPGSTPCPPADPIATGDNSLMPGQVCWRDPGIDAWLICYTRSGNPWFRHAAGEFRAPRGVCVLIRPGTIHHYGSDPEHPPWQALWGVFRPWPHWLEYLRWPEASPGVMKLDLAIDPATHRLVIDRLTDMHRFCTSSFAQGKILSLNALESALLWIDRINPLRVDSRQDRRVAQTVEYICQNLREPLDVGALVDIAGLSAPQLARLFRRTLGMSPMQYVEHERIGRAKHLLRFTQLSVQSVAREVGFPDPFYFSNRFRRSTGSSPRAFRSRARADPRRGEGARAVNRRAVS